MLLNCFNLVNIILRQLSIKVILSQNVAERSAKCNKTTAVKTSSRPTQPPTLSGTGNE